MKYDYVIIGGGCAGLGSAVYAARFGLKVAIFADMLGGLITTTHLVENYPGFTSLSGFQLAQNLIDHTKAVGAEIILKKVTQISKEGDRFIINCGNEQYESKSVLIATGTRHRKLEVPGEKELANKGVSYCATCDGPFFRNKTVGIVGGGDSAIKESLLLSELCQKVYIIYRGKQIRPEPINLKRMQAKSNIEVLTETSITEICGENQLEKVKFANGKDLALDGLFIEIGGDPQTELALRLGLALNEKGEIIIDKESKTNIEGVFSAGDCTNTSWKQAIIGVGEGTYAAYSAYNYIQSLETR